MPTQQTRYEISPARWPEDTEQARTLLADYGHYLAANPSSKAGVCLVGYEAELRSLPGKYATAAADLLLARVGGEAAGCVAITQRVMTDGTEAAEMKRLWVAPRFRGLGIGRGLVTAAIAWAGSRGCGAVKPCRKRQSFIARWGSLRFPGSMKILFLASGSFS